MTARYDLLLDAILTKNGMILNLFLFALAMVLAWYALDWTPAWMRRPARWCYVASLLIIFSATVIFGSM